MTNHSDTALVLFSGGQDSAVCLLQALKQYARVETVGFFYGQRHAVEMQTRQKFLRALVKQRIDADDRLGDDHVIDMASLFAQLGNSALVPAKANGAEVTDTRPDGLPATFVPGRNIFFLTAAATLASARGITHIIGGMCQSDGSGYPDCRDDALKSLQVSLSLGMGHNVVLHTPLMWHNKAQTWRIAYDLGGSTLVNLLREHTHSCYAGVRDTMHTWGYGCGECPACVLRRRGYNEFLASLTASQAGQI